QDHDDEGPQQDGFVDGEGFPAQSAEDQPGEGGLGHGAAPRGSPAPMTSTVSCWWSIHSLMQVVPGSMQRSTVRRNRSGSTREKRITGTRSEGSSSSR